MTRRTRRKNLYRPCCTTGTSVPSITTILPALLLILVEAAQLSHGWQFVHRPTCTRRKPRHFSGVLQNSPNQQHPSATPKNSKTDSKESSLADNSKSNTFRSGVSGIVSKIRKPTDLKGRIAQLENENKRLKESLEKLELEKDRLEYEAYTRIVLENFEGDNRRRYETEEVSLTPTEEELLMDDTSLFPRQGELNPNECPLEPDVSFTEALKERAYWLVGLLILQSGSGIILAKNEVLLEAYPSIVYYLTMLVGAGGNAGNQASVRVIRGLALGTLNDRTQTQFLVRELKMALALSAILSTAGFFRAAAFRTPFPETMAVTSALALIVFSSIVLGSILPVIMKKLGVDPAHSSTTIQVLMDILGVMLAVVVSTFMLDSPLGCFIISKLTGKACL